ncbi:unnamed protein product, partial [Didymodactylos carnosus]
ASSEQLYILQSCDDFLVDGTFKALGYQNRYQEDAKFAHNINKIAAVAFIPPCDVLHAYSRLALDLDDDYQHILNYFEDTYIGPLRPNNARRQPTFSIEFWYMHTRTTQSSMLLLMLEKTFGFITAKLRFLGTLS